MLSSFVGSAHNMFEIFQDSMAITQYFKHSDMFGRMITNPKWHEINVALFLRQKVVDQLDLVARVFKLKSQTFFHDILKIGILGRTIACVYTIKFQKRLPQMHFLIFFVVKNKVVDVIVMDCIVCAEFPNLEVDFVFFNIIPKTMVHACGQKNVNSPCMKDGGSTKHYPKTF